MMRVTEPRHYATDALLRDGSSIRIRAIRPDDKQRLLALFERLSSRSVCFRFFQTKQRLTDKELRYFTELDFTWDAAIVATLEGYRGAPPGDREALLALLLRVSALVESVPELQEFDLNPVKVLAPGAGVPALDGRMRLAPLG